MAESTIVKTKRDGTITIEDGTTPTALSYTVAFEAGDLSLTIPGRTVNLFLDRGELTNPPQIRYGDDQVPTGTFTAQLRDVSDGTDETLKNRPEDHSPDSKTSPTSFKQSFFTAA